MQRISPDCSAGKDRLIWNPHQKYFSALHSLKTTSIPSWVHLRKNFGRAFGFIFPFHYKDTEVSGSSLTKKMQQFKAQME
jgi:hypothetical protein